MKRLNTYLNNYKKETHEIEQIPVKKRISKGLGALLISLLIVLPLILIIVNSFIFLELIYFLTWALCFVLIIGFSLSLYFYHKILFYPEKKSFKRIKLTHITLFSIIMVVLFSIITIIIGGQL